MNQPQATGSPFPDLSRAPSSSLPGASPETVANEIVACLQAVETLERRTGRVFEAVAANVGMSPRDPIAVAGTRIATDLDAGVTGQARNAYHNSRHICEVPLCSLFLARHAGLAGAQQARIAVAALVHDLHHDGTTNAGQPLSPGTAGDGRGPAPAGGGRGSARGDRTHDRLGAGHRGTLRKPRVPPLPPARLSTRGAARC
ncbi:MAG TPA: hypothetical protein VES73_11560 [Lamprocystis sp. (in: g-proteobacteria)]|nr:hypothetical protein [Lamprocystis sp. (in: g-proteobacteria)]